MTVGDICSGIGLDVCVPGNQGAAVTGVCVGDLLSAVMASAESGFLWLTIQVHLNVAAVAVLKEIPMVILTENRPPSAELRQRCEAESICLAVSPKSTFELCRELIALGL